MLKKGQYRSLSFRHKVAAKAMTAFNLFLYSSVFSLALPDGRDKLCETFPPNVAGSLNEKENVQCEKHPHRYWHTNAIFGMQNLTLSTYAVNQHFEQVKNRKAAMYTAAVIAVVILLLLIRITLPVVKEPIVDNGVEVNLGNSDFGSGTVPPMLPGEPAPEATPQQAATPPAAAQSQVDKEEEEPDPEDKEPAITKTVEKVKPAEKPVERPPVEKPKVVKEIPAPPQPKPKAQMGQYAGGKGPGGNNQSTANNSTSQGDDKFAPGKDKGLKNGDINSDNYKGSGGTGSDGIRVISGNRKVRPVQLKGEFSRNATVSVRIKVSPDGSGTYMGFVSGINEGQYTNIIKQHLLSREIQFNTSDEESIVVIQVVFKVN